MPTDCLFCRIASGALPAHTVHQDDEVLAFLDLHPIRPGHTLVIPRQHHVWFEEMPAPLAGRVTEVSQIVARRQKALYGVERVAMFFTGIHVPHAHAHVVPMHDVHDVTSAAYLRDGFDSFAAPPQPPAGQMEKTAGQLAAAVSSGQISRES